MIGTLLTFGIRHLMVLLNSNISGLVISSLMGVYLTCIKARFMSLLAALYFFIVHVMDLKHALTCLFLWYGYDDNIARPVFEFLQNLFNVSEMKLVLVLDIIFFGNPYSANRDLWVGCLLIIFGN